MKLELNIHVTYKPNRVPESVLRRLLEKAADHIAGEGLLTGSTDAEVIQFAVNVERLED